MIAVIINSSTQTLELAEKAEPLPGPGQIKIHVKAAGVNRPDIFQRKGNYPAPPDVDPDIPGLEVAGVVVEGNHTKWQAGDRVCALLAGGGYAEYVVVDHRQVLPVPDGFSFTDAAGLCETYFTVWSNIVDRGRFKPGESVLIHGGTSGIGVSAIQLVSALGGSAFVTAGSDEKCRFSETLGAVRAINYHTEDFESVIDDAGGVDIVLDMIGGEYTARNLRILKADGRLVHINAMGGRKAEVDLLRIMRKRLTVTGSTLRARDAAFKGEIRDALEKNVWPLMSAGKIKPVVYQTFSFANAMEAHLSMEKGGHIGKIILLARDSG